MRRTKIQNLTNLVNLYREDIDILYRFLESRELLDDYRDFERTYKVARLRAARKRKVDLKNSYPIDKP